MTARTNFNRDETHAGLVIRFFMNGYYLCDGKPPKDRENDGELYVGNTVKWFKTWEEADAMRRMIDTAYRIGGQDDSCEQELAEESEV